MRKFLLFVRSYLGTLAEADQLRQATIPIQAQQGMDMHPEAPPSTGMIAPVTQDDAGDDR
eukprot:CAMPEP_0182835232 /NCGR_PEP_ID=MMETSP0006_2-20121128/21383_1 /TAXON_ID=97485 /ORGANISM="Prymnesium parvum, Strain Texoma1" /LENGTH=59 /DNA_ID=CAMNT_0024963621 /DNA_START=94 /DNA_END=272 /DNA_ORIENTATION=+